MTKLFSLACWSVEHFKGAQARMKRIVMFLEDLDPDVFVLLEAEGKEVFEEMVVEMPGYS